MSAKFAQIHASFGGLFFRAVVLIVCYALSAADRRSSQPDVSGRYCYVRCLSKCVSESKVQPTHPLCQSMCEHYNDTTLCNATNDTCSSTCRGLTDEPGEGPSIPMNVSVAYDAVPEVSPWMAVLRWTPSERADLYIVQFRDATDTFADWSTDKDYHVVDSNVWKFRKPQLCPEYWFRVAAVNQYQISAYSDPVTLPKPLPIVSSPYYDLISAELINRTFVASSDVDADRWNKTIRSIVSFATPNGWNLTDEIVDITAEFYPQSSGNRLIGYSPQKSWISGTNRFELRLPGLDGDDMSFTLYFSVQRIVTICDKRNERNELTGYPYPNQVYNPKRKMSLPVFEFDLTCQNVENTVCPYVSEPVLPSCGVTEISFQLDEIVNNQASFNVSFDRLLDPKSRPLLYYEIGYGVALPPPENISNILPPKMSRLSSTFRLPNSSRQFALDSLETGEMHVLYICGIYDERATQIDWAFVARYSIDLTDYDRRHKSNSSGAKLDLIIGVSLAVAFLVAISVAAFLAFKRRRKPAVLVIGSPDFGARSNVYVKQPRRYDHWELPRRRLLLDPDQKLGSGAFAVVYKGTVTGELLTHKNARSACADRWMRIENCEVAVKMLPDYADESTKMKFRSEIELMKRIGYHERLVNLLACITMDEPICLIMEYCSEGDLLHYLRKRKLCILSRHSSSSYSLRQSRTSEMDDNMNISLKDVLSFAWQICVGLEYLSQKGLIHRDVAARNILVDGNKRAKIGDFGLCGFAAEGISYQDTGGRMPIKWMALEALQKCQFTTKSDVWSFGVLLHELSTLGDVPYPNMDPEEVEAFLENGNRLTCAPGCPDSLYNLMLQCWRKESSERPSFTELRQSLSQLLENVAYDYSYVNLTTEITAAEHEHSGFGSDHRTMDMDDQVFEIDDGHRPAVAQNLNAAEASGVDWASIDAYQPHYEESSDQLICEWSPTKAGYRFRFAKLDPSKPDDRATEVVKKPSLSSSSSASTTTTTVSGLAPKLRRRSSTTTTSGPSFRHH